jgi:anthranilate phosphoribosyltransferase
MKQILTYLFENNLLSQAQAKETLTNIGQGKYSEAEIASFITVYMMRKIAPEELGGFREALLDLCVPVDLKDYNTIDLCGTGGDEKNTFNISTLSAFILAGAGIKVAKHGNFAASSACGSSNIFEHFGYKFSTDQNKLRKEIEQTNICYFHAPLFHPALKLVGPVRRSLKLKTFFNLLGPMVNPSRPKNQIVGVYSGDVVDLYHRVLSNAGINNQIIHSLDGYDEISLTGDFRMVSDFEDKVYSPQDLGLAKVMPEELSGGTNVQDAAKIFSSVLDGEGNKVQMNVTYTNAAFAIRCYYPDKTLEESLGMAKESVKSGKAKQAFKKLIEIQ